MDIEFLKTFLAVYETGTFNRAAQRLNVTQSTISTRIATLEGQLGRTLFVRSRGGTEPTPAGRHFHHHAASIVRIWKEARQELVLPEHLRAMLSIGCQYSLWDALLSEWLPWVRTHAPQTAIRAALGTPETLIRQLQEGELDIGIMYMPQTRAGLVIDKLLDDKLILVSTSKDASGPGDADYVYIDWGPEFQSEHAIAFADTTFPALSVSHGMLALTHILEHGGSGYFPLRLVYTHLKTGTLHRIARAPWFSRPAFVVYPAARDDDSALSTALKGLRIIATCQSLS